jgi:membrane protein YdbS with pleckstrin-like domain
MANVVPDATNPAGQPGSSATPHGGDHEPPIFSGSVSLWLGFKTFALVALLEPASVAALIYGMTQPDPTKTALLVGGVALLLATNIMLIYVIGRIKTQRYKITRKLIEREQGLVLKRVDSLDLARVKDVELTQSFLDGILNIGTIELFSADRLNPDMRIEAIPNPRPVYEELRDAVIALNQRRGIVTPEQ